MKEFSFLSTNDLSLIPKLDVMKNIGIKAELTDYSIVLGGRIYEEKDNKKIGGYWLKGKCLFDGESDALLGNYLDKEKNNSRFIGIRPCIKFEYLNDIKINEKQVEIKENNGFLECEYGIYPQNVVTKELNEILENAYKRGILEESKNSYTIFNDKKEECKEYKCGKRSFLRIKCKFNDYKTEVKLSNGEIYKKGDIVWIEIKPIKWWIDIKNKKMFTDKIIYAGCEYSKTNLHHNNENFENSRINEFINKYLSKEILQINR